MIRNANRRRFYELQQENRYSASRRMAPDLGGFNQETHILNTMQRFYVRFHPEHATHFVRLGGPTITNRATNDACVRVAGIRMAIYRGDRSYICTTIINRNDLTRHHAGGSTDHYRWRGMWRSKSHNMCKYARL